MAAPPPASEPPLPAWIDAPPPHSAAERARALEDGENLPAALAAYEAALAEAPGDLDLICGLARVARRLDMAEVALALWSEVLVRAPNRLEAIDGRARALADLNRAGEAIEALRTAILNHPHEARLWNSLGQIVNETGDGQTAHTLFDEAVRLDPTLVAALHNRGDAAFDLGRLADAEADFAAAARLAETPAQRTVIAFARALLHLHRGELEAGWEGYEARLSPHAPAPVAFEAPGRPWTPDTPLDGQHLLVIGEQGVGDEIMLLGLVPDLLAATGPHGRLTLALDPRLHTLARRSFPGAQITAYATERRGGRAHRRVAAPEAPPPEGREVDVFAPLGSLPRAFRRTLEAFPRAAYLRPDPARVAHWRAWLAREAGGAPTLGLSWRSGLKGGRRSRHAPALSDWAPLLRAEVLGRGARVVHLQYGAEPDELATLDALAPAPLLRPPRVDLREDLDDLSALCVALDRIVSIPNATAALAAASGAETWFLTAPNAWSRLGTDSYPWYARTRSFAAERFGAWGEVVERVAGQILLTGRLDTCFRQLQRDKRLERF